MAMAVRVRLARWIASVVVVLVMLIMAMGMLVFQRLMGVGVFVAFADVKINAKAHEDDGKTQ
ncbi:MAG: hypothetical protein K2X34_00500, partial [Hyphomonadaceae bacterium]|nr:hypothetical protein [Hyphomonadaceae bacterium]